MTNSLIRRIKERYKLIIWANLGRLSIAALALGIFSGLVIWDVCEDSYYITPFAVPSEYIQGGLSEHAVSSYLLSYISYICSYESPQYEKLLISTSFDPGDFNIEIEVSGVKGSYRAFIRSIKKWLRLQKTIDITLINGSDYLQTKVIIKEGPYLTALPLDIWQPIDSNGIISNAYKNLNETGLRIVEVLSPLAAANYLCQDRRDVDRALEIEPYIYGATEQSDYYLMIGLEFLTRGKLLKAQSYFETANSITPSKSLPLIYLAHCQLIRGDLTQAKVFLDLAANRGIEEKLFYFSRLGFYYLLRDEIKLSRNCFTSALRYTDLQEESLTLKKTIALTYLLEGNLVAAKSQLKMLEEYLATTDIDLYTLLLDLTGDYATLHAFQQKDRPRSYDAPNDEGKMDILEGLCNYNNSMFCRFMTLSLKFVQSSIYDASVAELVDEFCRDYPDNAFMLLLRFDLQTLELTDNSATVIEEMINAHPKYAYPYAVYADYLLMQEDTIGALKNAWKSYEMNPNFDAMFTIGSIVEDHFGSAYKIMLYDHFLRKHPFNYMLKQQMSNIFNAEAISNVQKEDPTTAEYFYKRAMTSSPYNYVVYGNQSLDYVRTKKWKKLKDINLIYSQYDSTNSVCQFNLGVAYQCLEGPSSALRFLQRAYRYNPNDFAIAINLARTYYELSNFDSSIYYSAQALAIKQRYYPAFDRLDTAFSNLYAESLIEKSFLVRDREEYLYAAYGAAKHNNYVKDELYKYDSALFYSGRPINLPTSLDVPLVVHYRSYLEAKENLMVVSPRLPHEPDVYFERIQDNISLDHRSTVLRPLIYDGLTYGVIRCY